MNCRSRRAPASVVVQFLLQPDLDQRLVGNVPRIGSSLDRVESTQLRLPVLRAIGVVLTEIGFGHWLGRCKPGTHPTPAGIITEQQIAADIGARMAQDEDNIVVAPFFRVCRH